MIGSFAVFTADLYQCPLKPESVDYIITDPPYAKKYLHLWKQLGVLAAEVLKPGGLLIALSGTAHLPDVFQLLSHPDLHYIATIAAHYTRQSLKVFRRNYFSSWKPFLVYACKEKSAHKWFVDYQQEQSDSIGMLFDVSDTIPSRQEHPWEQSPGFFLPIVKALTLPNTTIYDPMVGIGAVGVAVLIAGEGRTFIGSDINEQYVKITQRRLQECADRLSLNGLSHQSTLPLLPFHTNP